MGLPGLRVRHLVVARWHCVRGVMRHWLLQLHQRLVVLLLLLLPLLVPREAEEQAQDGLQIPISDLCQGGGGCTRSTSIRDPKAPNPPSPSLIRSVTQRSSTGKMLHHVTAPQVW